MLKLRTLDDIDSATLERFRRDPCAFIEEARSRLKTSGGDGVERSDVGLCPT